MKPLDPYRQRKTHNLAVVENETGCPPTKIGSSADSKIDWELHATNSDSSKWTLNQENAKRRSSREAGDSVSMRQLEELLKRVDEFWIDGVLDRSAPDACELYLNKESRPDAINDPFEGVVEYATNEREVVGAGKRTSDLYHDLQKRMLILGQPGSGKTTTLLQLTRELIEAANRDPTHPIPVVFNLSTWCESQSLADWLKQELNEEYFVPTRVAETWLKDFEVILVLDGLDEVRSESRADCLIAINDFLGSTGATGIAVTSRFEEYSGLGEKLKLGGAIHLQPLSKQQVMDFIDAGGDRPQVLKGLVEQNEQLQSLAQSPLMLTIMSEVYSSSDSVVADGHFATAEQSQHNLFEQCVERMFRRRGRQQPVFERDETESWLKWAADTYSFIGICSSFLPRNGSGPAFFVV